MFQRCAHTQILKDQSNSESQPTLNHLIQSDRKYDSKHPKQLLVTEELVSFIAEDLMTLSVVESARFKKFVHRLDPQYQLPSRKHLSEK